MIHELGHILACIFFKRNIIKVEILPFGGLLHISSLISSAINEDLIIAISGIGMQLLLGIVSSILYKCNIIDYSWYQNIYFYNSMIIAFNLLPISPLDGEKIFKLLCEIIMPYKKTFTLCFIVSTITILSIIFYNFNLIKDNLLVFMFIVISSIIEYKNKDYYCLRFYLERLNHEFKFNRLSRINRIENMYKNRYHFINGKDEKEYLNNMFSTRK